MIYYSKSTYYVQCNSTIQRKHQWKPCCLLCSPVPPAYIPPLSLGLPAVLPLCPQHTYLLCLWSCLSLELLSPCAPSIHTSSVSGAACRSPPVPPAYIPPLSLGLPAVAVIPCAPSIHTSSVSGAALFTSSCSPWPPGSTDSSPGPEASLRSNVAPACSFSHWSSDHTKRIEINGLKQRDLIGPYTNQNMEAVYSCSSASECLINHSKLTHCSLSLPAEKRPGVVCQLAARTVKSHTVLLPETLIYALIYSHQNLSFFWNIHDFNISWCFIYKYEYKWHEITSINTLQSPKYWPISIIKL